MPRSRAESLFDFALLRPAGALGAPAPRTVWPGAWVLAFLVLVVGASGGDWCCTCKTFEPEEEARRQAADAQWLEQSVQFQFRRLEDDLRVMAREASGQSISREPETSAKTGAVGHAVARAGCLVGAWLG